jgi:hypothetical protein
MYSHLISYILLLHILKCLIFAVPVVIYGCETWSLTLREEYRLRVFENGVLRRMFGPKKDEIMRGWRKLHEENLNKFYSSKILLE